MAWDSRQRVGEGGPTKSEGDGRSPAGAFKLLTLFGAAEEKPPSLRFPFLTLGPSWQGVDDAQSAFYNQILDTRVTPRSWQSWEEMWVPEYRLGAQVGYNTSPIEPGRGSCIFLHILSQPEQATSGCTAMSLPHIRQLCDWLRVDRDPVLVQLPRPVYRRLRQPWGLP
jgi:L,D-peptidoglycan transpeptidase YkuD (ErfK/YbiS/YcfS/YnhG family)